MYQMTERKMSEAYSDITSTIEPVVKIGTSGFVLCLGASISGIEYFESTYPEEWKLIYEKQRYAIYDSSALWALARSGISRWSEIASGDGRVLKHASQYGITYGATASRLHKFKRYVITAARPDRELTDLELEVISSVLDEIIASVEVNKNKLTDIEISTLRRIAAGDSASEIAASDGVKLVAVKKRSGTIRKKLAAKNITHAVRIATLRNII